MFVLAAVVALGAAALAPTGVGQSSRQAQLRLMDTAQPMVRGTGFHARERVRLVVRAPALVLRSATASTGGGFTMRLPGVSLSSCAGFSITATGDRGSRATLKRAPGQCAQP